MSSFEDTRWDRFQSERELLISVIGKQYGEEPEKQIDTIRHDRKLHAERLSSWLDLQPDDRVIDLGSGVGFIAEHIAPRVAHLYCMDIGKHHIRYTAEYLKNFKNITCIHMNYCDFSAVESARITKIYASAVFIHFNLLDIVIYLEAVHKLLSPGGLFHLNIMEAEKLDIYENQLFRQSLERYRETHSAAYLVTWNCFEAVSSAAEKIGFSVRRTHEWEGGNTGLLLEKK